MKGLEELNQAHRFPSKINLCFVTNLDYARVEVAADARHRV